MITKYADTDSCPIAVEMTVREMQKLIELLKDADGPYRQLRSDLNEAYKKALLDGQRDLEYALKRIED